MRFDSRTVVHCNAVDKDYPFRDVFLSIVAWKVKTRLFFVHVLPPSLKMVWLTFIYYLLLISYMAYKTDRGRNIENAARQT